MLKTNLKIAWRNLVKDKQFTFLNVLGLSAGLACSLLILFWVNDEMSYDKFFANDIRLYQLMENNSESSSGPLSELVKKQIQGVEYAAVVAPSEWFPQFTISAGDKNIKVTG
jgi:putative ABC transport system permease protein